MTKRKSHLKSLGRDYAFSRNDRFCHPQTPQRHFLFFSLFSSLLYCIKERVSTIYDTPYINDKRDELQRNETVETTKDHGYFLESPSDHVEKICCIKNIFHTFCSFCVSPKRRKKIACVPLPPPRLNQSLTSPTTALLPVLKFVLMVSYSV